MDDETPSRPDGADPSLAREWLRQNSLIYGGLIAIGVVLVQPFLTTPALDASALVCVIAFAVAIPLLAVLVLITRQADFRGSSARPRLVDVTQVVAELCAFAGVVAGFWHITWVAGLVVLASGVAGLVVHSAVYGRLERGRRAP